MDFVLKNFKSEIKVTRLANVHYFEFTPKFHTTDDSHDFCELVYVDRGRIEISSDNYSGPLKSGCMIIHNANERHSLTCDEEIAPNIIILGFECNSPSLNILADAPIPLTEELQKMLAEIIKEARCVYEPPYDIPNIRDMKKKRDFSFGADQLIKNYLQIFLIKATRLHEQMDQGDKSHIESLVSGSGFTRISEVKSYLDENFTERISVEELCFIFNTNKTTLSKEFKRIYGHTIIDYVNLNRVEYTKKLLRGGDKSLTKIAYLMNMSSVHYLTALFKKYAKITPTEYINSLEKKFDS